MPHARGAVDGVRDGRRRRVDDDLADGFRAERSRGLVGLLELHVDAPGVQARRQTVREQARFANASRSCARDVLEQRMPDALHDAALGLDARERRVDGDAAIDHGGVVEHLDHAGFAVELDLHHAHHVRRRGNGRRVRGRRLGGQAAAALALPGDVGQRHRLARGFAQHVPVLEAQLARLAVKQLGGDGAQALLQLRARLLHRHAGDVGGRRGVGARVVGRGVGVGAEHGNVVHRAFHMLGDHLRQDGVAARAHVGRADEQHIRAVIGHFDGDRPHVHARDAAALHGHGNARGAHLAVAHIAHGILRFPVEHGAAMLHAAIERARIGHFAVVRQHRHALAHHVALA